MTDVVVVLTALNLAIQLPQSLQASVSMINRRRQARIEVFRDETLRLTGWSEEDLVAQLLESETTVELMAEAIEAARSSVVEGKISALARVVSQALSADQAVVDAYRLLVKTIDNIEAPHVQVLTLISELEKPPDAQIRQKYELAVSPAQIAERWPGVSDVLVAILIQLQSEGLIAVAPTWGALEGNERWQMTDHGRRLLELLKDEE